MWGQGGLGLMFWAYGLGFRVQGGLGLVFRADGLGFRVHGVGLGEAEALHPRRNHQQLGFWALRVGIHGLCKGTSTAFALSSAPKSVPQFAALPPPFPAVPCFMKITVWTQRR